MAILENDTIENRIKRIRGVIHIRKERLRFLNRRINVNNQHFIILQDKYNKDKKILEDDKKERAYCTAQLEIQMSNLADLLTHNQYPVSKIFCQFLKFFLFY